MKRPRPRIFFERLPRDIVDPSTIEVRSDFDPEAVQQAIDQLPEKHAAAIRGWMDGHTLLEVGKRFRVTRQRVLSLRDRGMEMLRAKMLLVDAEISTSPPPAP